MSNNNFHLCKYITIFPISRLVVLTKKFKCRIIDIVDKTTAMDPNNLDPKLKETYDRVMGTQTAPPTTAGAPATPPQPSSAPVNPVVNTSPTTTSVVSPDMPQIPETPAYTQDNLNFQAAIQTPVVGAPLAAQPEAIIQQHKPSSLLKILYIIGAIVFFVAYTFLWIKIFNLPLPF
jgi:hypothetical protein